MSGISIFIADDHNLVREGLRALIEADEGMSVAGEAADLTEVLDGVEQVKPQVVLLDVYFPQGTSFAVCRQLKRAHPEIKVIFLTGASDDAVVNESMMSEGDGFLLKGVRFKQFASAIRDVMAGRSVVDQSLFES